MLEFPLNYVRSMLHFQPVGITTRYCYTDWNGTERHVAASTCLERLRINVKQFDLFENAMVCVPYPRANVASSCLNHHNHFSHYCASPS